jgi:hypothetical protein
MLITIPRLRFRVLHVDAGKKMGLVSRSLSRQERAGAREPQFCAGLIISSKLQDETHATPQ